MATDVGIRLLAEDGNFINRLDEVIRRLEEVEDKQQSVQQQINRTTSANESFGQSLAETVTEAKRAEDAQQDYSAALQTTLKDFSLFGVSYNSVIAKANEFRTALRGSLQVLSTQTQITDNQRRSIAALNRSYGLSSTALTGVAKAARVFRVALLSTGIGAIVIALGALISFLTTTQRGSEALSRVFAAIGAVTELLVDGINDLGESIFDAVTNPRQAVEDFWEFLKNIPSVILDNIITRIGALGRVVEAVFAGRFGEAGKAAADVFTGVENTVDKVAEAATGAAAEIAKVVTEADNLRLAQIALEKAEIALGLTVLETRANIRELNREAEDTNNTYAERRDAIEQAYNLENDLLGQRILIAERNLALVREDIRLNSDGDKIENLRREAEAQGEIATLRLESAELLTTLGNRRNQLAKEEQAVVDSLRNTYDQLTKSLTDQLAALQLSEADPLQRLVLTRDASIQALNDQRAALIETAEALGQPIDAINEAFDRLIDRQEDIFSRSAQSLELGDINQSLEVEAVVSLDQDSTQERIAGLVDGLSFVLPPTDIQVFQDSLDEAAAAVEGVFSDIEEFLQGDAFTSVQAAFGQLADSILESAQIEIDAIDRRSEARNEDIDSLQDEIDREQSLLAKGFDFNTQAKEDELKRLQDLEEADQERREELVARQQRLQLIQDSITQASSLVTASSNIFKTFSVFGPLQIPLAITAIGAMFAAFAKAKVDAFAATRLHTGADSLYEGIGMIAPGEASDIPGRGDGLKIVDNQGQTRARVGGNEMLIDEKTTHSHGDVFKWIRDNKHLYSAFEMIDILKGTIAPKVQVMNESRSIIAAQQSDLNYRAMKAAHKEAIMETMQGTAAALAKSMNIGSRKEIIDGDRKLIVERY